VTLVAKIRWSRAASIVSTGVCRSSVAALFTNAVAGRVADRWFQTADHIGLRTYARLNRYSAYNLGNGAHDFVGIPFWPAIVYTHRVSLPRGQAHCSGSNSTTASGNNQNLLVGVIWSIHDASSLVLPSKEAGSSRSKDPCRHTRIGVGQFVRIDAVVLNLPLDAKWITSSSSGGLRGNSAGVFAVFRCVDSNGGPPAD